MQLFRKNTSLVVVAFGGIIQRVRHYETENETKNALTTGLIGEKLNAQCHYFHFIDILKLTTAVADVHLIELQLLLHYSMFTWSMVSYVLMFF